MTKPFPEIKPCPWCKEPPVFDKLDDDFWKGYPEYCLACMSIECNIRPSTKYYKTKREAIDAWNRREGETP